MMNKKHSTYCLIIYLPYFVNYLLTSLANDTVEILTYSFTLITYQFKITMIIQLIFLGLDLRISNNR